MKFEELKKVLFKYGAFHDCLVNSIEIKLELNCINLYLDDINKCIVNKKEQQKAILFFSDRSKSLLANFVGLPRRKSRWF